MKYSFYSDPGHGWVKVNRVELDKLGILNKITSYSYQRNDNVYLEEDCDLSTFLNAKKELNQKVEFKEFVCRSKQSKIRSYRNFVA